MIALASPLFESFPESRILVDLLEQDISTELASLHLDFILRIIHFTDQKIEISKKDIERIASFMRK